MSISKLELSNIQAEVRGSVGLITLDRPKAMNALCSPLMDELTAVLDVWELDNNVGAVVITGNEKVFAAGADIKEMSSKTFVGAHMENFITAGWERITTFRKPVIAAVSGYALGGGCELAMMCDFILAADNAQFGQPEIKLGIIPGAGGTQRLTRLVGKSKAMELCLTGRNMGAEEAERAGLVARVVPVADLLDDAMKTADTIASYSLPSLMLAKASVDSAMNTSLTEGIAIERRMFHSLFATNDQKEGMAAFIEKRKPGFTNS